MTMEEMPAIKPESSLRTRLKSALIFGPVVLFLLYVGGFPFSAMMAFAGLMGGFEWARMVTIGQNPPRLISRLSAFVVGVGVLCAGMVRQPDGSVDNPAIAFSLLLALTFVVYAYNFYHRGPSMRQVVPGLLYIGLSLDVMVWIRNGMDNGLYHMLTLLCIVWASDIFAYFTGRAIGGPRLAPKISPKKTWAGFIGSSIGAGLFAAGLACPWILNAAGVETLGGMGAWG